MNIKKTKRKKQPITSSSRNACSSRWIIYRTNVDKINTTNSLT